MQIKSVIKDKDRVIAWEGRRSPVSLTRALQVKLRAYATLNTGLKVHLILLSIE